MNFIEVAHGVTIFITLLVLLGLAIVGNVIGTIFLLDTFVFLPASISSLVVNEKRKSNSECTVITFLGFNGWDFDPSCFSNIGRFRKVVFGSKVLGVSWVLLLFINGGDDGRSIILIEGVHGAIAGGEGSSRKNSLSRGTLVWIEVMAIVFYWFQFDEMYKDFYERI